jgi:peroxiredoxin
MAKKLEKLTVAPDFELKDTRGEVVRLSEVCSRQPVVLVMNRGFV